MLRQLFARKWIVEATAFIALITAVTAAQGAHRKRDSAIFRTAVQSELRDPNASFEAVRMHNGAVCGRVEAKNSVGGNTGQMLFVYVRSDRRAYVLGAAADMGAEAENAAIATYQEYCERRASQRQPRYRR
jgi:hypothetical protein